MKRSVTNTLSIFIDESGDFGPYNRANPFYILTFVFHEQHHDLTSHLETLNERYSNLLFNTNLADEGSNLVMHAGPIIRNEDPFNRVDIPTRQKLLRYLLNFTHKAPISYHTFVVPRTPKEESGQAEKLLRQQVVQFAKDYNTYLRQFDELKVYYDKGQEQITALIDDLLIQQFQATSRTIQHKDFRLAQVADLLCTLELVDRKTQTIHMSKSERAIFIKPRDLQRNWLNLIAGKKLKP